MSELITEKFKFSKPAIYQIKVIGNMDKSWFSRLSDMQISLDKNYGEKNEYHLIGKLKDQAELLGILNTLFELHLVLKSVKILKIQN